MGAAFLLYRNSFEVILETSYNSGCLSPERLLITTCDPETELTEGLLYVISKADRLLYRKGCTFIVYNIDYLAEVYNIYRMIMGKLLNEDTSSDIIILDYAVIVEKDED